MSMRTYALKGCPCLSTIFFKYSVRSLSKASRCLSESSSPQSMWGTPCCCLCCCRSSSSKRYGNRQEIALLPIEHLFQFSTLFQSFTGKTEIVELLPISLRLIDGSSILLDLCFFRPYYNVFNDTNSGVWAKVNQRNRAC